MVFEMGVPGFDFPGKFAEESAERACGYSFLVREPAKRVNNKKGSSS